MAVLFSPIRIADLDLANRIVVSPMSQYSAIDGMATDWHFVHYGMLSNSGAGLVMVESTHIDRQGQSTSACLSLYNDAQERALGEIVGVCRAHGSARLGLQLNHSGRKASSTLPWVPVRGPLEAADGAWETIAASAIPFGADWPTPVAATIEDMERIKAAFVSAAERALRVGFDLLELHGAHGYLLHSFISPLANNRHDQYGGSFENRVRYLLEIVTAVRSVWPAGKPLGMKVSSTDWDAAGWTLEDAVALVKLLKQAGCDYVCMSSGATTAHTNVAVGPNYQTRFAARVKQEVDIVTWAVGLINTPKEAERLVAEGWADMVTLARAFIDHPHWAWNAANRLGAAVSRPRQYGRAAPEVWPDAAAPDLAPATIAGPRP